MYVYGGYEINAGILSDFHKIDLSAGVYMWDKVSVKNPKKSPGKNNIFISMFYLELLLLDGNF